MHHTSFKRQLAIFGTLMAVLFFLPCNAAAQKPKHTVLTNADIVLMSKAGIPTNVIIAKIKRSPSDFDTSPQALVALKDARVSDAVIMTMVEAKPIRKTTPTPSPRVSPSRIARWVATETNVRATHAATGNNHTTGTAGAMSIPTPEPTQVTAPSSPTGPSLQPAQGPTFVHSPQRPTAIGSGEISPGQSEETPWHPVFDFDGQFYPSVVLELEGNAARLAQNTPANYFGDPIGMAGVTVLCETAGEQVKVGIRIDGLSRMSTLSATLDQPGQHYYVYPTIRYETGKLARIPESYPTTVEYSVAVDGQGEEQKTISIQVHSVNDVPFAIQFRSGQVDNISELFAGFVDENDPFIQSLLQQALSVHAVNQFDGYQGGPQGVEAQVFAIWNVLQRRRIHYSSTATASAESPWGWVSVGKPDGRVLSQTVRFLDQSISDQQANCIDGAVLFASALYKIGIDPLLVILPDHAFVGYYLDPQHREPRFLETTLVGQGPMPLNLPFGPLYQIGATASWKEFLYAVQVGNQEFNQEVGPNLGRNPRYMMIDIQKARNAGINPIPRPF